MKTAWTAILLTAFLIGFSACGENRKEAAAAKAAADSTEMQKRKEAIDALAGDLAALDSRIADAKDRLPKQGNKTRKALAPGLSALDSARARIAVRAARIDTLSEPAFTHRLREIHELREKALQDLDILRKRLR